ncbi:MAG: SDR family oxidoreductase [Caldilineaceae bacterium]|nr:SDR family oxidoreductase [Caldilineaceae bacterium]
MNMKNLADKVVLVAGASSGMGRATALAAAQAGATVVIAARNQEALTSLQSQIQQANGTVLSVPTDAAAPGAAQALVAAAVAAYGRIDILINSIGANIPRRTIAELTDESWQMMMETNLTAAFHLTQAIMPLFRQQQNGLLIHITSGAAKRADRSGIAYQATKAGVSALAHGAMEEEKENGVRVTVIYPGLTETPLVYKRPTPPTPELLAKALQPEDVAAACMFVMGLPERAYVPELVIYPSRL